MNPIDELVQKLARHPELRFAATATSVEIEAPTPQGFAVSLRAAVPDYVVSFEGWHEHFKSGEDALACVAFAYSGRCRLATTYRGRIPVKWVLESFEDGRWVADSEVGHFVVPFWLRPRIEYRQNPSLLAAAMTTMRQACPRFPVVAFSPAGWAIEAASEDEFADASPWDDLREWQGLEVFDSAGQRFIAARAFCARPRNRLGLWVCRMFGHAMSVGFEWEVPRGVPLSELRQRLEAAYPAAGFDDAATDHETLIRRCL